MRTAVSAKLRGPVGEYDRQAARLRIDRQFVDPQAVPGPLPSTIEAGSIVQATGTQLSAPGAPLRAMTLAEGIRVRVTGSVRGNAVTARSIEIRSLPAAAPTAGSPPSGAVAATRPGTANGGSSPGTPPPVASAPPRASPYVEDTVQVTCLITAGSRMAAIKMLDTAGGPFTVDARKARVLNGNKGDLDRGRIIRVESVRSTVIEASTIRILR
ncbi:MAG: hypothetical protein NTW15_13580 [Burkholderiales bacterium]|nr:hypothetical protein [Burkholderiales bacterium]